MRPTEIAAEGAAYMLLAELYQWCEVKQTEIPFVDQSGEYPRMDPEVYRTSNTPRRQGPEAAYIKHGRRGDGHSTARRARAETACGNQSNSKEIS